MDERYFKPITAVKTEQTEQSEEQKISFFNSIFWDLWLQKIFRNFASMKFQLMAVLIYMVFKGMFTICAVTNAPWISAAAGLAFLGGGFATIVGARIAARTKLTEDSGEMDCDK